MLFQLQCLRRAAASLHDVALPLGCKICGVLAVGTLPLLIAATFAARLASLAFVILLVGPRSWPCASCRWLSWLGGSRVS